MKHLRLFPLLALFGFLSLQPAAAQFGGCLPAFCSSQASVIPCVNSGHAAAFLARTSGLDGTHVTAYTNLLNGLDSDGLSCKLDALYIYATQDSVTALLNLISSSYNSTVHGAPIFTIDRGFTGVDGSSTIYIDTGFAGLTAVGAQFTLNSAHFSVWELTNVTSTFGVAGAREFTQATHINPHYSGDGNAYSSVNENTVLTIANANSIGHYLANRTNNTATQFYKNGSSIATSTNVSSGMISRTFYTLALNEAGIAKGSDGQLAEVSIGASFDATDTSNFYTLLRTYMTAVGVP